jgi:hypothetical protein
MGQLNSTRTAPPREAADGSADVRPAALAAHLNRGVALQVAFERQTLKPVCFLDRL